MLNRYKKEAHILHDNFNKEKTKFKKNTDFELNGKKVEYFLNGIPNLFIPDISELTETQSYFYNDIKFPNYDDIDDFYSLIKKGENSIFAKMLDNELPMNCTILEAGCGTGQMSLFLSRFNRIIHSIDLSEGSLELAENFRKKNKIKNVFFYKMNIFNLLFRQNAFDVVISNGVLHHTHSTRKGLQKLIEVLKPNGLIIIGLYHKYGRFLTNVRQIINKFNFKQIKHFDPVLSKNISQKKKYAWFKDQYENPYETSHTLAETLDWFKEFGLEYISSIPFDFDKDPKLLSKREVPSKYSLLLKEFFQLLSPRQIKEGGFFIVIGKKL